MRVILTALLVLWFPAASLAVSYRSFGLSPAHRDVLDCLEVVGGRLQASCPMDLTLGGDVATGQVLTADEVSSHAGSQLLLHGLTGVYVRAAGSNYASFGVVGGQTGILGHDMYVEAGRSILTNSLRATSGTDIILSNGQSLVVDNIRPNSGATFQLQDDSGSPAVSVSPGADAQVWQDLSFNGLGELFVDTIKGYSTSLQLTAKTGYDIIVNMAQNRFFYMKESAASGAQARWLFKDNGSTIAYDTAGLRQMAWSPSGNIDKDESGGRVVFDGGAAVPSLTAPSGYDLRLYAPSGYNTKIQQDGGGMDVFYIDASENVVAQPASVFRMTSGAFWTSSIAGSDGLTAPSLTKGVTVPAGQKVYTDIVQGTTASGTVSVLSGAGLVVLGGGSNFTTLGAPGSERMRLTASTNQLKTVGGAGWTGDGGTAAVDFDIGAKFSGPVYFKKSAVGSNITDYIQVANQSTTGDLIGVDDAGTPTILIDYP